MLMIMLCRWTTTNGRHTAATARTPGISDIPPDATSRLPTKMWTEKSLRSAAIPNRILPVPVSMAG
jgi:hypothetical protein